MNQFNIIDIYMKTLHEKEKKLTEALEKLNNLEFQKTDFNKEVKILDDQKNQLEIEKDDLENRYNLLQEDYKKLKLKIEELNEIKSGEKVKEVEFSEKIDELNQETDILLEEIEKWRI